MSTSVAVFSRVGASPLPRVERCWSQDAQSGGAAVADDGGELAVRSGGGVGGVVAADRAAHDVKSLLTSSGLVVLGRGRLRGR